MSSQKINKCRLCKNTKLVKILNFGKASLGNNLQKNKSNSLAAKEYPLQLYQCNKCNHFQLSYSVDPKFLYATNYTYLSKTGESFVKYLKDNCKKIIKKIKLKKNSVVLDVGSNDGTALSFYQNFNMRVCGIDPAKIPAKVANKNKIFTYNNFFSKKIAKKIISKFGKADLIISHNTLAHVKNIENIFKNIYFVLKNKG